MSPFDIAVFVFFISVVVKACVDTYHFWFGEEESEEFSVSSVKRVPVRPTHKTKVTPIKSSQPAGKAHRTPVA